MTIAEKFKILTEGAKYDVSCSSSGANRGSVRGKHGLTNVGGVCHSFTADGRCISLLKVLLTNNCIYDCQYCVNRKSADVPRAKFEPEELCKLVMGFYDRNYIEGLFLSSAVFRSPDDTMEQLIQTIHLLREKYSFNGYIHLKAIPGCDQDLLDHAAQLADRISVNMELPSKTSLKMLCPDKKSEQIVTPIKRLSQLYVAQQQGAFGQKKILPAGQTTQMIIGASPDTDYGILRLSEKLYRQMKMKRVYYSAYIPTGNAKILPIKPPDLIRENRLYQADWLLRFYGFEAEEILERQTNLALDMDPKCAWALRHPELFPIEVNTADPLQLMRVPGIGIKSVNKILAARKTTNLTYDDLKRMKIVMKRAVHFILCSGKYYGLGLREDVLHRALISDEFAATQPQQLNLLDEIHSFQAPSANTSGDWRILSPLPQPSPQSQYAAITGQL